MASRKGSQNQSGKEKLYEHWSFDPAIDVLASYPDYANRGVAYWQAGEGEASGSTCDGRVFVAPIDARLIALDMRTGEVCEDFGVSGSVDLRQGVLNDPVGPEYQTTSPPVVLHDLVIVGSAIADNQRVAAPSGLVRAFDARSGELRWAWDPIPRRDDEATAGEWRGAQARTTGAANVWTVMSADPDRDLLFVPTSSPSPDFYGGERIGDNRHANSLAVLRGSTGELVWSFQAVHHDVWDYDLPAQPVLASVSRGGEQIPVVVQMSKMGLIFVLHRETGEPLFPIEERPVPASTVPGEVVSATQPFPSLPKPLAPIEFDTVWGATPEDEAWCRELYQFRRNEGLYTPPSLEGSILYPGNLGASNWSGAAFDPDRGLLVAPANRLSTIVRLIPEAEGEAAERELRRAGWEVSPQRGTPYWEARTFPLSPSGLPCEPPPWGTLTGIDLESGERRWEVPLGITPGTEHLPGAQGWGSVNLGGPIVTRAGLVFIAGSLDAHLRAFDIESGAELWAGGLPAGGHATPMTYTIDERQFVTIAAGGHGRLPSPPGDYLVAFALPQGENVRAPTLTPERLAGEYAGYLRVEGAQYDVTLELRTAADERDPIMTGVLRIPGLGIEAAVSGEVAGGEVALDFPFSSAVLGCGGDFRGQLVPTGPAGRLAGGVQTSGDCSGSGPETGRLMVDRSTMARVGQNR